MTEYQQKTLEFIKYHMDGFEKLTATDEFKNGIHYILKQLDRSLIHDKDNKND